MTNSLGIDKDPKDTRVVVAMSGGVDSSVAAALLHEQGYDVIGVTLQLYDMGTPAAKTKTCCAGQDIYDAKRAHDLGADCMATGHYIKRTMNGDGIAELHRAHDHGKDQSYFLFATTQEQLDFLRFPLGGWSKDKTREEAMRLGLLTADKPDSQDICFVPGQKNPPRSRKAGRYHPR